MSNSLRELRDDQGADQTLQNLLRALTLNLELRARYRVFEFEAAQDGHPETARLFRELREAGEASGEELREALAGSAPQARSPETAARCFRILGELGLVQGEPAAGGGVVGVVSSEGTDLERSASYRAYSARHEEARQYLEAHRQP